MSDGLQTEQVRSPAHLLARRGDEGGQSLSNMAMIELLQGGFRRGPDRPRLSVDLQGLAFQADRLPNEMSETALVHTVSDQVDAAYRRGDMREKRHQLMAD